MVSVNRLLNFAEFWITKCRKFVKFPFGQCHLVFVLHKSFLWFENQESWLTLGVFIKLWNCQTKLNVNFTYFLRSIFQIILIRLNVVVNGSKKRFLCSSWDFGSYEISGLKVESTALRIQENVFAFELDYCVVCWRLQKVRSLEVSALVVLLAVLAVVERLHHLLVLLGGEQLEGPKK